MKKSICALFLLVFCVFMLTGCQKENVDISQQNAFRIIRKAEPSGKIELSYIFPVNSAILKEKGFEESEIATYKFYLATYVTALSRQYEERAVDGVYISGCTYFTDVDGLGFTINFENLDAQKAFFEIPENEESSNDVKTSGFFMKKVEIEVNFPVSSTSSADNFKLICQMAITSWCNDSSVKNMDEILKTLDNSVFIYDFVSSENTLKSDTMRRDGNVNHNIFVRTQDEIAKGSKIVFYSTTPNVPVWYVSALVVVVAGMVVAWMIMKRKIKKKHS